MDKKISELDAATALLGSEQIAAVQGAETRKTSIVAILTYLMNSGVFPLLDLNGDIPDTYLNENNAPFTDFVPYTGATSSLDMGSNTVTATQLISTVATWTAPLTVASSTLVTNLQSETTTKLRNRVAGADLDASSDLQTTGSWGRIYTTNFVGAYSTAAGNVFRKERHWDLTSASAISTFEFITESNAATEILFRKLTAQSTWSNWVNLWHSGNSGTTASNWAANALTVAGKITNAKTLVTTTGTGTYNLDFSLNNEYVRTISGTSTITCSNGVSNDVVFIKITGNFTLAFGAGITVLGSATYNGSKGAYIGIKCVSTGVYYAKIQDFN